MIALLSKWFIRDRDNVTDPAVRRAYGSLCGIVGIALNLLLFAGKFFAGVISGSIAVTADAFNNLSDAGSSVITLLGFRLAGRKPDPDHPFGHGRIEYVSGLVVAALILLMGVELGKSSFEKILHPEAVDFSILAIVILAVSVAVKLYMSFYNSSVGKKIHSAAMLATAADSRSDAISTAAVLAAMLVAKFTALQIDGYVGMIVAILILIAGIKAGRETLDPLLGQAPEEEFVQEIERIVLSHDPICGIHDLVVHDYGPGRVMITLHAEVPAHEDILALHDVIDTAEVDLAKQLGCTATIHMDPIVTNDDGFTDALRHQVAEMVKTIDPRITIHDFRCVPGPTHTNLIFDAVVPYDAALRHDEVEKRIKELVHSMEGNTYFAVVKVETPYVKM